MRSSDKLGLQFVKFLNADQTNTEPNDYISDWLKKKHFIQMDTTNHGRKNTRTMNLKEWQIIWWANEKR